jgi:hypothetical protein
MDKVQRIKKKFRSSLFLSLRMNKMNIIVQWLFFIVFIHSVSTNNPDSVTCSSAFKLVNQQSGDRLHSHDVKYGSGSGQQVLFIEIIFSFICSSSLLPVHQMLMM